jgi:biotin transport system substrate-specific component
MKRKSKKLVAADIAECGLFVALMCAGAYIQIPFYPVPLTFQTVIAVLCGLLLGWKKGIITLCVYTIMGLIGIPVFSAGGGLAYVLKPSFGYILGFIAAAGVAGIGNNTFNKLWQRVLFALAAYLVDYIFGITYFIAVWQILGYEGLGAALITYNLLYMPKDAILCVLAAVVAWKVTPAIYKGHMSLKSKDKQTDNQ